ncbi:MAG: hypothetical protein K6G84_06550 [Lachnospiraceae bacterium]|nr:hypothetical protein [Lachnospiraceae bacterium]
MLATIPILCTPTLSFIAIRGGTVVVKKDIHIIAETLTDLVIDAGLIVHKGAIKCVFLSEKYISDYDETNTTNMLYTCSRALPGLEALRLKDELAIEEVPHVPNVYSLINGVGITR